MSDRQLVRSNIRRQRRELSLLDQSQAAHAVAEYIQTQPWYLAAHHIGFYAAVYGEVDPYLLLEKAVSLDKTCYLPILKERHDKPMEFVSYSPGDPLRANEYCIFEPLSDLHVPFDLQLLDLVFVPLLAFDANKNRLGSGKGYYDKTFSHMLIKHNVSTTKLVGLAYGFQQVNVLDVEDWDVPMDRVIVFDAESNQISEIN